MTHSTQGSRVPVFSLGDRIRKIREDLGMSQAEFAIRLGGVDRKTVGNWEGGKNRPRQRDLMMISSVADVNLAWLMGGEGTDNTPSSASETRQFDDSRAYVDAA